MNSRPVKVIVEADGGSRGNPGPAGYGAVVRDATDGTVLAERKDAIGIETNNVAEYRGLLAGLEAARELGARDVQVRMDSKLVVEQMNGRWHVKHPALLPLAAEAGRLRPAFDRVSFAWVPREQNRHADRLANEAMDEAAGLPRARPNAGQPSAASAAQRPAVSWVPPSGTATSLYLVRHGSTAHSAQWRFSGSNDLPLDDRGRQQAASLAAAAPRRLAGVAAVVSSPLLRARQTAEPLASALGLEVELDPDLAETDFGAWEGLAFDEVEQRYPEQLAAWLASTEVAPPGGESFDAVARRTRRARNRVIAAHPGQPVVVVSHVTPIKILLRLALDAPPLALFKMHLDLASISRVDYYGDGNPSLRLVNETTHLR